GRTRRRGRRPSAGAHRARGARGHRPRLARCQPRCGGQPQERHPLGRRGRARIGPQRSASPARARHHDRQHRDRDERSGNELGRPSTPGLPFRSASGGRVEHRRGGGGV
ncbi:MAG: hypothetical protein AVDCRST_MAG48-662, partial [uncultured Friedmanniella sp.]